MTPRGDCDVIVFNLFIFYYWIYQAAAGLIADCRQLGNRARSEAANYRELFDTGISGKVRELQMN